MEHTIVILKKLKERNSEGKFNFSIASRYTLTDSDIEAQETVMFNDNRDPDDEYEYYAEIEETRH